MASAYSFNLEVAISEELERILKYCQESIPTCNAPELAHILKFLECVQALNEKMMKGTGLNEPNNDDPEIAKIKRTYRIRHTHTDQTIRLIKDQLLLASILKQLKHMSFTLENWVLSLAPELGNEEFGWFSVSILGEQKTAIEKKP